MRRIFWFFLIVGCSFSLAAEAQTFEVRTVGVSSLQDSRKIEGILWNCKSDVCRTNLSSARIATVQHCRKLVAVVGRVRSYVQLGGGTRPALTAEQIAQCNAPEPTGPLVVPGVTPPPAGMQPNTPRQLPSGTKLSPVRKQTTKTPKPTQEPPGLEIRAPLLTVSGAEPVALPKFTPVAFTSAPLTVSGAPEPELPPFEPLSFRTPELTVSGAPTK